MTKENVAPTKETENNAEKIGQTFDIQRLYIKDISFETPNSPSIFQSDWKPELNLDLNIATSSLTANVHEVVLKVTVTVKSAEKVAFLIEVHQAGIFLLQGFVEEQLRYMLGSFCPNVLFPYAREMVSELVARGGFPPLYLAPINFDAFYQQHEATQKKQESDAQK